MEDVADRTRSSKRARRDDHPPGRKKLVLLGAAGQQDLQQRLGDRQAHPMEVIKKFQQENGLSQTSCLPALPLLDLLNFPRHKLHLSLATHLRDSLLSRINALEGDKLDELLERTFPYLQIKELQPVAVAVLSKHHSIPPQYLNKLAQDQELYVLCPIEVQQQIWLCNGKLFRDTVDPLLQAYIQSAYVAERTSTMKHANAPSPRERRRLPELQALVDAVGSKLPLYNKILEFVRVLFVKSGDDRYCVLRADLLMALHDREVADIYAVDPCHEFAWCLAACMRDSTVDLKRARQLELFFQRQDAGSPILGDLGMIVRDPMAVQVLARCAFATLVQIVRQQGLPFDDEQLRCMVHLLEAADSALNMIRAQEFHSDFAENDVLTAFLPMLAGLMVDDRLAARRAHYTSGKAEDLRVGQEPPERLVTLITEKHTCRLFAAHYLADRILARDSVAFFRLFNKIPVDLINDKLVELLVVALSTKTKTVQTPPPGDIADTIISSLLEPRCSVSVLAHWQLVDTILAVRYSLPDEVVVRSLTHACEHGLLPASDDFEAPYLHAVYRRCLSRLDRRMGDELRTMVMARVTALAPEDGEDEDSRPVPGSARSGGSFPGSERSFPGSERSFPGSPLSGQATPGAAGLLQHQASTPHSSTSPEEWE